MIRGLLCFFVFLTSMTQNLFGSTHGRIDAGPIYLRLKVQESGKTIKTLEMAGARADATLQIVEDYGFVLKPFLYGASGDGDFYSGGLSVGHYTPVTDNWTVTPMMGWTYSNLQSTIDIPYYGLTRQREKFKSNTYNLGFEVAYQFMSDWYLSAIYQYGFARTHTTIGSLISAKGNSQGSSFGLVLDYYFKNNWVVTGAFGYNNSLSKEKHGIEGIGFKAGLGYWY